MKNWREMKGKRRGAVEGEKPEREGESCWVAIEVEMYLPLQYLQVTTCS